MPGATLKRVVVPELLDHDQGTPGEVRDSLTDLRFFNRRFGGVATGCWLLGQVARKASATMLSVLDVAAGSGDVAAAVSQRLLRSGVQIKFTLSDRRHSHLPSDARAVAADALALPFRDASFDVVSCGLFVHHLDPAQVLMFAREALRVSCLGLVINDLIRHPLHLALVYAGLPLYRSRLTRHDAPASVRAAYRPEELLPLLQQAGAVACEVERRYLFRMGVIAWKR